MVGEQLDHHTYIHTITNFHFTFSSCVRYVLDMIKESHKCPVLPQSHNCIATICLNNYRRICSYKIQYPQASLSYWCHKMHCNIIHNLGRTGRSITAHPSKKKKVWCFLSS